MPKYTVLSPINAGNGIQRDGTVELTDLQAAPLIAQGVLAAADADDSDDAETKTAPKKTAKAK